MLGLRVEGSGVTFSGGACGTTQIWFKKSGFNFGNSVRNYEA